MCGCATKASEYVVRRAAGSVSDDAMRVRVLLWSTSVVCDVKALA
jgi:hypothetical protein